MMKNPAPAPAGFAIKIRQNPAPARFEKSKSGTTLAGTVGGPPPLGPAGMGKKSARAPQGQVEHDGRSRRDGAGVYCEAANASGVDTSGVMLCVDCISAPSVCWYLVFAICAAAPCSLLSICLMVHIIQPAAWSALTQLPSITDDSLFITLLLHVSLRLKLNTFQILNLL